MDSHYITRRRMLVIAVPTFALLVASACGGATSTSSSAPASTVLSPISSEDNGDGALVTGAQPSNDEIRGAVQAGRSLVISLRLESEPGQDGEEQTVVAAGGRFERIAVAGASGLTRDNVARLHALLEDPGSTVLHCGTGNRAGAMLALHAFLYEGADEAAAVATGEAAGLRSLRPAVEERLRAWCAEGLGSCAGAGAAGD